jgi:acetyl-CoA C-acetyltransferase
MTSVLRDASAAVGVAWPVDLAANSNAERHPLGATRVAQCVELYQQLRGGAVDRIGGARIALAHNIGGPTAQPAVTILEGPWTNGG